MTNPSGGRATLRVSADAAECEFVRIPRPLERSETADGERPRLEQRVIEGDPETAL